MHTWILNVIRETLSAEEIRIRLLLEPVVGHPTAMIPLIFKEKYLYYAKNDFHAEDYKLLVDSVLCGGNILNLPDFLYNTESIKTGIMHTYQNTNVKLPIPFAFYTLKFFYKVIIVKELYNLGPNRFRIN